MIHFVYLLLVLTISLFAVIEEDCTTLKSDCPSQKEKSCPKPKKQCCLPLEEKCTPMEPAHNAPYCYSLRCAWDVTLYGDFLYWQAREDHLEYGVTTSGNASSAPIDGEVLGIDFGWYPGMRVGLGCTTKEDNWSYMLEWTHLVSHNNTTTSAPDNQIILPTRLHPDLFLENVNRASTSFRCIYNTFDALLGRAYFVGKKVIFNHSFGVRGFWIWQTLNTEYENFAESSVARSKENYDSWGIGPRYFFNSKWMISEGFRLFTKSAFSLLFTSYYPEQKQTASNPGFPVQSFSVKYVKENYQIRPNAEAALGFGWGSYIDRNNWYIDFSLAYEFHYWWGQNALPYFVNDIANGNFVTLGDLALQGISVRMSLDF